MQYCVWFYHTVLKTKRILTTKLFVFLVLGMICRSYKVSFKESSESFSGIKILPKFYTTTLVF